MTSRRLSPGLVLLRLAPAITAAASVTFAGNMQWILELFTHPEFAGQNPRDLSPWLDRFFRAAVPKTLGLVAATTAAAVLNIHVGRGLLRAHGALGWYLAGAALAGGHLGFASAAGQRVRGMVAAAEPLGELRGWLRVNAVRGLTADLGAWACLVVAAVRALSG